VRRGCPPCATNTRRTRPISTSTNA
jgi:hypothetical protein